MTVEANTDSSADDTNDERIVPLRLQKFLSRAGIASRRGSENLMTAGRVTVNGEMVRELGTKIDPLVDIVCVDGKPVSLRDGNIYVMLHKPAGYLTTMNDPQGRPTVASLVPVEQYPGLFPVGRLDCDTTGLLLFCTDGELAQRLLHPKYHVSKRYEAMVDGRLFEQEADILRKGITLDDGPCNPAEIIVESSGFVSRVTCIISEGRKRQVKRMFSAIGHPVLSLHRASFGVLSLGDLPVGEWRELTDNEVNALRAVVEFEKES
ncbi:MAG: rRNA pseudouridine synthase [Actinobacteria bacterium]|nr:rRNA pseudouridine synthase [Actinomycetota bacterium]